MNTPNLQRLVLIACGIVLWTITVQINHYLAPWHINLFTGGLVIAFPALRLPQRDIWRIALPLGLWHDAAAATPFGAHMLLFLLAAAFIRFYRARIPRADTIVGILTAILIALAIALAIRSPHLIPAGIAWTLTLNTILSAALIALVTPWYFALQSRALVHIGINAHMQAEQTTQG